MAENWLTRCVLQLRSELYPPGVPSAHLEQHERDDERLEATMESVCVTPVVQWRDEAQWQYGSQGVR